MAHTKIFSMKHYKNFISVPNMKEINPQEGCHSLAQNYYCKTVQRKM